MPAYTIIINPETGEEEEQIIEVNIPSTINDVFSPEYTKYYGINYDRLKELVHDGDDPSKLIDTGMSPLMHIIDFIKFCGDDTIDTAKVDLFNFLLDHSSTIDVQDVYGKTALMHIVDSKYWNHDLETKKELIKCLLNYGANPDIPDALGQTPLIIAATRGASDFVNILMKKANPYIADNSGQTFYDALRIKERKEEVYREKLYTKYKATTINELFVHDNGGRPYRINLVNPPINANEMITKLAKVYNNYLQEQQEPELITTIPCKNVFIGKDNKLKQKNGSYVIDSRPGNTMLFEVFANFELASDITNVNDDSEGYTYVYIKQAITKFTIDEPIINYYSDVGNNDVPYPIAETESSLIFMTDLDKNCIVPKIYFDNLDSYTYYDIADAYDVYHGQSLKFYSEEQQELYEMCNSPSDNYSQLAARFPEDKSYQEHFEELFDYENNHMDGFYLDPEEDPIDNIHIFAHCVKLYLELYNQQKMQETSSALQNVQTLHLSE